MKKPDKTKDALARKNFFYFVWKAFEELYPDKKFHPASHIQLICFRLQSLTQNPGEDLLVTVPPRYGKSFIIAICFIAWMMGHDPALKFLVASYGEGLAEEHADLFKKLVSLEWYKRIFPGMRLDPKRSRSHDIHTTRGGRRKAISTGGEATGFGADIIVIDDIIKASDAKSDVERQNKKEYLDHTLFSRLNDKKNGHIIANQQRFHEDDPAAYLIGKGFNHLCLRAIAEDDEEWPLYADKLWQRRRGEPLFPELEDLETLERIRKRHGSQAFAAQHQQNPVNPGGNQISWGNISFYAALLARTAYVRVVQSWDTACMDGPDCDYSACATIGLTKSGVWHVLDMHRGRYSFSELRRKAIELAHYWKPDYLLIEKSSNGFALITEVREVFYGPRPTLGGMIIHGHSPIEGKVERFHACKHWLEEGELLFPENAPFMPDVRREFIAFPEGRNDDYVDALMQAIEVMSTPRGKALLKRDPVTGRTRIGRRSRR